MDEVLSEMRRIQCSGNSTFLITLPKKWVERLGLKNGDNMNIIPVSDRTILFKPLLDISIPVDRTPPYRIDMRGKDPEDVLRAFTAAYLAGYDSIRLEMEENDIVSRDSIRFILSTFTGLDIIEEDSDHVIVRDLTVKGRFSFEQSVRRVHLIVRGMMKEIPDRKGGDAPNIEGLQERYAEIKRFHLLIMKNYTRISRDETEEEMKVHGALGYLLLVRCLERISRHVMRIGKYWDAAEKSMDVSGMNRINAAMVRILDQAMEAFNRGDLGMSDSLVNKCVDLARNIRAIRDPLLASADRTQASLACAFVLDSMDRIVSYMQDICEISINQLFSREFAVPENT